MPSCGTFSARSHSARSSWPGRVCSFLGKAVRRQFAGRQAASVCGAQPWVVRGRPSPSGRLQTTSSHGERTAPSSAVAVIWAIRASQRVRMTQDAGGISCVRVTAPVGGGEGGARGGGVSEVEVVADKERAHVPRSRRGQVAPRQA